MNEPKDPTMPRTATECSQAMAATAAPIVHKRHGFTYLGEVKVLPDAEPWHEALRKALDTNRPYVFIKQDGKQYLVTVEDSDPVCEGVKWHEVNSDGEAVFAYMRHLEEQVRQHLANGPQHLWITSARAFDEPSDMQEVKMSQKYVEQFCSKCGGTGMVSSSEILSHGAGFIEGMGRVETCPDCHGAKVQPIALASEFPLSEECVSALANMSVTSMAPRLHKMAMNKVREIVIKHAKI